jgi:hypothetical protein
MTVKQLIAYVGLLLMILGLIMYIVFREPTIVVAAENEQVQRDSIQLLLNQVSDRDSLIVSRDVKIDSLELADKPKNQQYVKTVQFINNPSVPIRSLDSIVRAIISDK